MYMEFLHKRKIILVVDRCFVEGVFGPEGKASWFAVITAEFAQSVYSSNMLIVRIFQRSLK